LLGDRYMLDTLRPLVDPIPDETLLGGMLDFDPPLLKADQPEDTADPIAPLLACI